NRCGEVVLAFTPEEQECLRILKDRGEEIGVPGLEILEGPEIHRLEPQVASDALAALHMPTAGVFNPFDLVQAFYENAAENGVLMWVETEVSGIIPEKGRFLVETDREEIDAAFVVNAAGLYAQKVAEMAGADDLVIQYPTKSTCFILDKAVSDTVSRIVTGFTDLKAFYRFKAVIPTFGGNLLLYTTIPEPAHGIEDRDLEKRTFQITCKSVGALVPGLDFERHIIASFSGLTARNVRGDFIIEASKGFERFIHVALPPPGITSSPAIGRRVAEILREKGLALEEKADFNPYRKRIRSVRKASPEDMSRWVKEDARYGRVVCRCEKVTEGEILEAIGRGASTLDGVKFRTRAGMGRCQGNFCTPPIVDLLAQGMKCPVEGVTKKGKGSNLLMDKKPR
ncbi:MAG: FAD-dependent oxidoreductase, partial [Deltaproteobacteria bacterium]|nr:FAD-dependent oxidoreductase [Deltaproteobacteria bacterium]